MVRQKQGGVLLSAEVNLLIEVPSLYFGLHGLTADVEGIVSMDAD